MATTKPTVLITIDWFLPGTASGGPVRSIANMIAHLDQDFEFLILTRNTDYLAQSAYPDITANTWIQFNAHTRVYYMSADRLNRNELKRVISSQEFDLAYITGIYSWWFSILPLHLTKALNKPVLVSARGMLNPQAFSVKPLKKKLFLVVAKLLGLYRNVQFHATNEEESSYIKQQLGSAIKVHVAPNLPRKVSLGTIKELNEGPRKWVSVARIAKEKGTLHLLESLLQVRTPLQIDLYGPIYDPNYWQECELVIQKLPEYIEITNKGSIPGEEIPKVLKNYNFFVMLSEGENFGHAIFEAFSQGLPVLISDQTPWKDLEQKQIGWDMPLLEKHNIAKQIDKANTMSKDRYRVWSQSCLNFAKAFSEDPHLMNQNKALFLDALKAK